MRSSGSACRQGERTTTTFRLFTLLLLLTLVAACTGPRTMRQEEPSESSAEPEIEVTVEAYLFDTWLWYEGKRSSMRLEVFVTDSIIGAGGRSYLGKGALKGWIRDDSLQFYFPQSDEFVYEPIADLLLSVTCTDRAPTLAFLDLFYTLPDSVQLDSQITVRSDYSDEDRPGFELSMADCPWVITMEYDRRDPGWRIREFEFDNGDQLRIEARRREYKDRTDVGSAKFRVRIPESARQIIP